ncbi:unnamed protein product [Gulo gulo]|uniref:Uncharacterized protein n=1 Tax=Gulo gulo TaxID=48420 RepID=A0A9X9M5H0_GULGU|nr:unnamed protein product [Gulo gulo]
MVHVSIHLCHVHTYFDTNIILRTHYFVFPIFELH